MFNHEYKKEAQEKLRRAVEKYQRDCEYLQKAAGSLYQNRVNRGVEIIQLCENYINTLANSPKEFSKVVTKLKFQLKEITGEDWDLIYSAHNSNVAAAGGAGVMAGAGVALLGPTAAMAIATTFGTASTGTAIASLSGAAAVNAALAWLGGGALTVGGGGMVAGNALLALAGPIGWGIGGVALAGSALWKSNENEKIGDEANKRAIEIEGDTAKVNITKKEVNFLKEETVKLANFIQSELQFFKKNAPLNYLDFSQSLKQRIATLINSINSLSESLKKTVDLKM
ncbi:hypothetical protein QUB68_13630 [Microcoleus sp. A006_D1]|uniref:hypothetical protein n=1 Tax=Microcoleus sp. A006_D1 TaxID=3055267 RepID=UPI002FD1CEDC